MLDAQINIFDAVVIGIIVFSGLISFFRGFVREVLSLGAWVGAALVSLYSFPSVAQMLAPYIDKPEIASGFAALGTFMVALIAISMFNGLIMRYVKQGADVGFLDNTLGLGFGALRGALLISLGYFVLTLLMSEDDFPAWVKEAQTRKIVESGALLIARVAPDYLDNLSPLSTIKADEAAGTLKDIGNTVGDTVEGLVPEQPAGSADPLPEVIVEP